jgi:Zn-dependent protease with chaperone function
MNHAPIPIETGTEFIPPNVSYRRPGASLFYQLSLLPVGLMMVLLPMIYLALLATAAYGVYYHGTHNFGRIMAWGGLYLNWRIQLIKGVIFVAPLFAGIVLVFFMIKPLFAARGRKAQPYALNPEAEPRLFAFITSICQMVGAPPPRRIDLDCNLNAAAGFRRGFRSFFGRDLILVLGLPLIATISVEEFAAVLAHEFGHFSQGIGMKVSYIIRTINRWFARVVFERDAWDEMLDDWERGAESLSIIFIVLTARIGVWVSRSILYLLMFLGHLISSAMERQQEFNADAYAINAVGSDVYEKMIRRLEVLDYANSRCLGEMRAMWKNDHALPDNFPLLLANKVEATSAEVKAHIDDRLGLQRTGLFDAHPCVADRIRQARRLAQTGFIRDAEPATGLFEHFPVPARFVTLFHYQEMGIPITRDCLKPIQLSRVEREEARAEFAAILDRYFCGLLPLMNPVCISSQQLLAPKDAVAARQGVKEFRPRLAAVADQVGEAVRSFCNAQDRESQAGIAAALIEAECSFDPQTFQLADSSIETARLALSDAKDAQQKCRRSLHAISEGLEQHLTGTLGFLHLPSVANAVKDSENFKGEMRRLASFLHQFSNAFSFLDQCRHEHAVLTALSQQPAGDVLATKISESVQRLNNLLYKIREATITLSHPFEPPKQSKNLFDRFAGKQNDSTDPAVVRSMAVSVIEGFNEIYKNSLGRLAQIAEEVEAAL